jgi:hypothetical protein
MNSAPSGDGTRDEVRQINDAQPFQGHMAAH